MAQAVRPLGFQSPIRRVVREGFMEEEILHLIKRGNHSARQCQGVGLSKGRLVLKEQNFVCTIQGGGSADLTGEVGRLLPGEPVLWVAHLAS